MNALPEQATFTRNREEPVMPWLGGGADVAVGMGSRGRRIRPVFAGGGLAYGAEAHIGASYTYLPWVHKPRTRELG